MTFTCPHGIDTSYGWTNEWRDGVAITTMEVTECLRCTEEAGRIVLMTVTEEMLNAADR